MAPITRSNAVAVAAFVLAAGLAADSILGLGFRNGWMALNEAQQATGRYPLTPPHVEPVKSYTGVAGLDAWLWTLVSTYWAVLRATAERPALPLFVVYFLGQALATHTLVVVEGLRRGNKGRFVRFSTIWGNAYQNIPWGITKNLYIAFHLGTSPTAKITGPSPQARADLTPDAAQLRAVPWAMLLGYVLPTVAAGLPWPQYSTPARQEVLIAAWHFFPLWVGIAQCVLGYVLPGGADTSRAALARRLRRVYDLAVGASALIHVAVIAYVACPSLRPAALSPPAGWEPITLQSVFVPMAPWSRVQATSFTDGFHTLLKYDWIFACGSTLAWAAWMLEGTRVVSCAGTVGRAVVYAVVLGPGAAAVMLVKERDERLVLGEEAGKVLRK